MARLSRKLRLWKWIGMRGCLLLLALACAGGCQSGYIDGIQSSTDGKVIAFRDAVTDFNDLIYVADAKGVRAVSGKWDGYVLSSDGQWLVLLAYVDTEHRGSYTVGDPLTLIDLVNNRRYTTKFPVDTILGSTVRSESEQEAAILAYKSGPPPEFPCFYFGLGPRLILAFKDGECWEWKPSDPTGAGWTRFPAARRSELALPSSPAVPLHSTWRSVRDFEDLIYMPCDGLNAPRILWVRPDRSVLELDRKNDAPIGCLLAIIIPYGRLWDAAIGDLRVDPGELAQAKSQLQRQIEKRRRAITSQPSSVP